MLRKYQSKTLFIVGVGIKTLSHLTEEAKQVIENTERVLFLVNEPLLKEYITENAKSFFNLEEIYFNHAYRADAYNKITEYILSSLENYDNVGVVAYGHPFFCASPFLDAAIKAKDNGCIVHAFPGISSLDCMFSDLMIDPTANGLQVYEATALINSKITINTSANLVILQVGFVNVKTHTHTSENNVDLTYLCDYLKAIYPEKHSGIIYQASLYPSVKPKIDIFQISELSLHKLSSISSIFIPPENNGIS